MEANEIQLTPDFKAMFTQFARDAAYAGRELPRSLCAAQFEDYPETPEANRQRAAVLRVVQHFLAPLTIALQSATSAAEIEQLREVMSNALSTVDKAATACEEAADKPATICTVDMDDATYLGSEEDGIYFDVAQDDQGKWYMSAAYDTSTGHACGDLVTDDGPYEKQSEALLAGYSCAYDWLVTNSVRGWRKDAANLNAIYKRMAKEGR